MSHSNGKRPSPISEVKPETIAQAGNGAPGGGNGHSCSAAVPASVRAEWIKHRVIVRPTIAIPPIHNFKAATVWKARDRAIYSQGDRADALYYVQSGRIKLSLFSAMGREAVVGLLGEGDFFGEGCVAGQPVRHATATAATDCILSRIAKEDMLRTLAEQPPFAHAFVSYVLARISGLEADLASQLCDSCERRLARVLLLLADREDDAGVAMPVIKINQSTLAAMVGTSRPRISLMMNSLRERGLIDHQDELRVNRERLRSFLSRSTGSAPVRGQLRCMPNFLLPNVPNGTAKPEGPA